MSNHDAAEPTQNPSILPANVLTKPTRRDAAFATPMWQMVCFVPNRRDTARARKQRKQGLAAFVPQIAATRCVLMSSAMALAVSRWTGYPKPCESS